VSSDGACIEVTIEGLGADGDGVARLAGRPLYVPFTLPGERVRVRILERHRDFARGRVEARLGPALGVPPSCRHFGSCGGCRLQHLPADLYHRFRIQQVIGELVRRRIRFPEPRLIPVPPARRRRVRLAWRRERRLELGYRALRAHRIVEVQECPVADPWIVGLLPELKPLLFSLNGAGRQGEVVITRLPDGLDLLLRLDRALRLDDRERLAAFARAHRLVRLSVALADAPPEPLVVHRLPQLLYGSVRVTVPADAFLQATEEGEQALRECVGRAIWEGARLLDLFAGLGALSLPFRARLQALHLVEGAAAAVASLREAVARSQVSGVSVEERDLAQSPLRPEELNAFDLIVLDPPRAGAAAQVREIAASRIGEVVYISCNPASFARDARMLADAGFHISELSIIDQFLWSSEVELAARLSRQRSEP
jgi:23S rRNA (uracil1939-C5)-methyltransferase